MTLVHKSCSHGVCSYATGSGRLSVLWTVFPLKHLGCCWWKVMEVSVWRITKTERETGVQILPAFTHLNAWPITAWSGLHWHNVSFFRYFWTAENNWERNLVSNKEAKTEHLLQSSQDVPWCCCTDKHRISLFLFLTELHLNWQIFGCCCLHGDYVFVPASLSVWLLSECWKYA